MIEKVIAGFALLAGSFVIHAIFLVGVLLAYSHMAAVPSVPVSLALMFGLPLVVFIFCLKMLRRLVSIGGGA